MLLEFWDRARKGGRKSFRFDELDLSYEIKVQNGLCIHYLEQINKDLLEREKKV